MATWRNTAGKTLSSPAWLEAHHRAKLPERTLFARGLRRYRPARVVDLGCGTGLWLDLIDKHLPAECEFIGIDSDVHSLELAAHRARSWRRRADFLQCDVDDNPDEIPAADLMLAFNVFPYLANASALLGHLSACGKARRLIIRQYDGGTMRIGPLSAEDRFAIDSSLRAALDGSSEFDHYALDRTYDLMRCSPFTVEQMSFDLTERHAPFPAEFEDYFRGTVEWMREHLSDDARARLDRLLARGHDAPMYFLSADLIGVLSASRSVERVVVPTRAEP